MNNKHEYLKYISKHEYLKCLNDPYYFIINYCRIKCGNKILKPKITKKNYERFIKFISKQNYRQTR